MLPAIPLGTVLAAALTIGSILLGFASEHPLDGGLILGAGLLPPSVMIVWGLVVDRHTLRGAPDRPEESVESEWYGKAVYGAFHDILLVVGIGTTVLFLTPVSVSGSWALFGVLVVIMVSTWTRFIVYRRRGGL